MKDNQEELFPIVDEDGNITGAATRGECHSGSKLLLSMSVLTKICNSNTNHCNHSSDS